MCACKYVYEHKYIHVFAPIIISYVATLQNNPPPLVQERILGLIQTWADAFRGKEELQAVVDLYQQLKDEDWEFPPVDLDSMAPINTPQRVSPPILRVVYMSAYTHAYVCT